MWGRIIPTLRAVLQTVSAFWGNHWKSILIAVVALTIYLLIHQETDALLQYFYPSLPIEAYKDKVVWIVGASSGIGEALSKRYVRAGASVIISARRLDLLNVLAEDCSNYGEKPMVLPMDLTNITEHTTYVTKALSVYDHIDIVILNAGIFQFQSAIDTTYEQTEEFMKLNFLSYVSLTRLLLPSMMKFQTGQVWREVRFIFTYLSTLDRCHEFLTRCHLLPLHIFLCFDKVCSGSSILLLTSLSDTI